MNKKFEDDFWLTEYVELWARYRQIVEQLVANERYALIFSGGVWAWVLPNKGEDVFVLVSWVPFIVAIFFYIKAQLFLYKAAGLIVKHIEIIADNNKEIKDISWLVKNKKRPIQILAINFLGILVFG